MGLALGDAGGAPYEGGFAERLLWKAIGRTRDGLPRWTDDTRMALDLAGSLLSIGHLDQDDLALRFSRNYHWSRGYGPGTARLLKRIRRGEDWRKAAKAIYESGSYGNGAAMRAAVVALYFQPDLDTILYETRRASEVTHAHPLGIEGAILMAASTHFMLQNSGIDQFMKYLAVHCTSDVYRSMLSVIEEWIKTGYSPPPKEVVGRLGNSVAAPSSVMTAIYLAIRFLHSPFVEMLDFIRRCGGDADTIGAMAGALWGAYNGNDSMHSIPVEQRDELEKVADLLYRHASATEQDAHATDRPIGRHLSQG